MFGGATIAVRPAITTIAPKPHIASTTIRSGRRPGLTPRPPLHHVERESRTAAASLRGRGCRSLRRLSFSLGKGPGVRSNPPPTEAPAHASRSTLNAAAVVKPQSATSHGQVSRPNRLSPSVKAATRTPQTTAPASNASRQRCPRPLKSAAWPKQSTRSTRHTGGRSAAALIARQDTVEEPSAVSYQPPVGGIPLFQAKCSMANG